MEAVKKAVLDRNENVALMEPLALSVDSRHRATLTDLAVDLAARSAGFRRSLPSGDLYCPRRSRAVDELLLQQFNRGP